MSTEIYLIRHGQTEYNKKQLVQGWYDSALTEEGYRVADLDGEVLADVSFTGAYSSDLSRAYQTARHILLKNAHLKPDAIVQDPGLREVSFGLNAGAYGPEMKKLIYQTMEQNGVSQVPVESLAAYLDISKAYDPSGRAENFDEFTTRIDQALESIAKEHAGEKILVVSHGMVIKTFFTSHFPKSEDYPSVHNGALSRLRYRQGQWEALSYNEVLGLAES